MSMLLFWCTSWDSMLLLWQITPVDLRRARIAQVDVCVLWWQVASIQQERAGTEGLVAELGAKCKALERWLDDNEWKVTNATQGKGSVQLDINKVVVAADDLSRQAMSAQAEDLAVEDALVVLDKALHNGKLQADTYLKQVSRLAG